MNEIDSREFRDALSSYPTGVAVITTRDRHGEPVGITVNSFASVSLDPPLILWSIDNDSGFYDVFMQTNHFAVHILRSDQRQLSHDFSSENANHFDDVGHDTGIANLPLLKTYSAVFQCEVSNRHSEGDHVILLGRVLELQNRPAKPLVFFAGHYHKIAD
ncbi:MAG: flavin reductase family protein [Gammaproteobacteria bacterium]|nr:flavin reductase family protein [Gammaproteobacteria bacterium]